MDIKTRVPDYLDEWIEVLKPMNAAEVKVAMKAMKILLLSNKTLDWAYQNL